MKLSEHTTELKAIMLKRLGGSITVTAEELRDISGEIITKPSDDRTSWTISLKVIKE